MPNADLTKLKMPSIIDIHILKSHLTIPPNLSGQIVNYDFSINIDHKMHMDKNQDEVFTTVEVFVSPINDKETIVGEFNIGFHILVLGLGKHIEKSKSGSDKVLMPDNVTSVLNAIVYSTTRGIVFMETKGTFMHTAIMPVLDSSRFTEANV